MFNDEDKTLIYNIRDKITQIFDTCYAEGEDWSSCLKKLFDEEIPNVYDQLPWLNECSISELRPNQLVRFRGMVQDILEPEYYTDTYLVKTANNSIVKKLGRYFDVCSPPPFSEVLLNDKDCDIKERNLFYCISIPGEAPWVKEVYRGQRSNWVCGSEERPSGSHKRKSEEADEGMDCDNQTPLENRSDLVKKRKTLESDDSQFINEGNKESVLATKASKFPLNFTQDQIVCLLKVYGDDVNVYLNGIVEVVGIIGLDDPVDDCAYDLVGHLEGSTIDRSKLPTSVAPRLHAITITKRSHCNPLLPAVVKRTSHVSHCSTNLTELLRPVVNVALLGDDLATDYLISHLISSVHSRQDSLPIGKFCLNLSGITSELIAQEYPKFLFEFIRTLTTISYKLTMSLDNMNKMTFIPKKNYENDCLTSGLLQLPSHMHLVLDETSLSPGRLDENGLKNIAALGTIVSDQKVDYDYQYFGWECLTDVPVLILSIGKSMINSDFHVKLVPRNTIDVSLAANQLWSMLSPQLLDQIRIHLTLSRASPHNFTERILEMVQEDFVQSRQNSSSGDRPNAESLHCLLTLARFLSQSSGRRELTEDIWTKTKCLERERRARLSTSTSSQNILH